jgi:hypothetical protein
MTRWRKGNKDFMSIEQVRCSQIQICVINSMEQKLSYLSKVTNQLDATKKEFYSLFLAQPTFGHQYAHHQEYNIVDYSV